MSMSMNMSVNSVSTRRQSWATVRKTMDEDTNNNRIRSQKVTWSPVEESSRSITDDYSGIPITDIWYTRDELRQIRVENEQVIADHNDNDNETTSTLRGLESWTDQGAWERFQQIRDCVHKVLDEQDRQRGIDKSEYQFSAYPLVKRVNHLHIAFDHERLAALCRDVTAKARRTATLRGKQDYQQALVLVQEIWADNNKSNQQDKDCHDSVEETDTCTTCTDAEDTDDDLSVASVVSSSVSAIDNTCNQLPLSLTVASLEEKNRARYAAYLINRQDRMAARERADYAWEQRKLQRRASIRLEADASIDQLKRILKISNELVQLIAAKQRP